MEQKMITIPFEVEKAKKIQAGELPGKIVTRCGYNVRIVCWDMKGRIYPILALVDIDNDYEDEVIFTSEGFAHDNGRDFDLMLQVPEWMQYKDGDVIYCDTTDGRGDKYIWIAVMKELMDQSQKCISIDFYFSIDIEGKNKGETEFDGIDNCADYVRLATYEEKQQLIDALKASNDPRAKEYLKRFFGIEEKQECEFKPKDWVLGRMASETWCLCQFSHKDTFFDGELYYVAVGGIAFKECIPYNEQTKHLLGTTENWEEQQ